MTNSVSILATGPAYPDAAAAEAAARRATEADPERVLVRRDVLEQTVNLLYAYRYGHHPWPDDVITAIEDALRG